ncbi:ABC transporter permease [Vibrio sp. LaRot3]|uniref:ABC transporter permease n=1 Tax=Vibrio sp. LaRot3 TaxID=2998829 RepID=UPI0022CDFC1C|nr:thiamine ABC transporter permease [Vibrio sp. LaRot3]MDA0147822.1 thiamine ABC transporter permease [Vibrio sp. LaRot3]
MFRASYLILIIVCIAPVAPGLIGVSLSSFGYIPPIGLEQLSLGAYSLVFDWSGVAQSIFLTLFSSIASTYLAALVCFAIIQQLWFSRHWRKVETMLSPLLALPHVAFAIGFAFLLAPTGVFARIAHEVFNLAPNNQTTAWFVNDAYAIGLTLALAMKEVPFLLLMSLPILLQLNLDKTHHIASALGYSPSQMWLKIVFPQWLNKMRFALFAVIAYGAAVVDLSLILGPTNPPTFAVLVWQWFSDPDLTLLPRASAGAMVLFAIASALLLFVVGVEKLATQQLNKWQYSGRYGFSLPGKSFITAISALALFMLPIMLLWSFAHRWRFPDLLPSRYSLRFWQFEWQNIWPTIEQSLLLAVITAFLALFMGIIAQEYRVKHRFSLPNYIIALPMLVPQLSLLFGLQITTLYLDSDQFMLWVIWSHLFFAFPFVYLALDGPWRSYNDNFTKTALSLGKKPLYAFVMIKGRILLPALLYAWAIGASVSLAQYLPTLILGGGRVATITTEAVALSSGFDRRVTAIYAIWQAILPLIFFMISMLISHKARQRTYTPIKETLGHDTLSQKPFHQ